MPDFDYVNNDVETEAESSESNESFPSYEELEGNINDENQLNDYSGFEAELDEPVDMDGNDTDEYEKMAMEDLLKVDSDLTDSVNEKSDVESGSNIMDLSVGFGEDKTFENDFDKKVESMSLEELKAERERLVQFSQIGNASETADLDEGSDDGGPQKVKRYRNR